MPCLTMLMPRLTSLILYLTSPTRCLTTLIPCLRTSIPCLATLMPRFTRLRAAVSWLGKRYVSYANRAAVVLRRVDLRASQSLEIKASNY